MNNRLNSLKKVFFKNPRHYLVLLFLLLGAFLVRTYKTDQILRFYYDQGRDALVIYDMIHVPKPVLVGPTTGLAGIMRGPAFYYLLLPAYVIGQGSPIIAAIWLQVISLVGLVFIYLVARQIFSPKAGLLAVFFIGFSNHFVSLSRWLSEPSVTLTAIPIILYGLLQISRKNRPQFWWPVTAFVLGLSFHFELTSEIWFIPAILFIIFVNKKYRPSKKTFIISSLLFLTTFAPQVIFDIRHDGIMSKGIATHFSSTAEPSFGFNGGTIIKRLNLYLDSFATILVPQNHSLIIFLLLILFFKLLSPNFHQKTTFLLPLILFPLFFLLFYQGNGGNFYSYYLIGLFPIFIILISGALSSFLKPNILIIIPIIILALFSHRNFNLLYHYLTDGIDGRTNIVLGNQLQAIDWIYQDAQGRPFNIDVFVPPIIPYSYDYLFIWYGNKKYNYQPDTDLLPLLYTIHEAYPDNLTRAQAWLDRQSHIGEVKKQSKFGGIGVQRRQRF